MARLTKEFAIRLSEPVEDAYLACIDRLIINICKHLGTGKAYRTADWELQKLSELGQLTAENAKIINEAVKSVPQKIRDALSEASKESLRDIESMLQEAVEKGAVEQPASDSVQEAINRLQQQAIDKINLTNTTMLDSTVSAYQKAVQTAVFDMRAAEGITNQIGTVVSLSTETRNAALKKAISQLLDDGIYGLIDRAGRKWSPEAYASMLIRTTSHNASIDSIKARQSDYGTQIFQISEHTGARPLCYPYQGKFYTWGDEGGTFKDGNGVEHTYLPIASTSYGQAAGIFGINCGHYPLPQIPDVTIPSKRKIQPEEENSKEYLESQQQRYLERRIRDAKRAEAAYREASLFDAADDAKKIVSDRQADMRAFIKETGRKRRYDRENVR